MNADTVKEYFPDGSEIPDWFRSFECPELETMGTRYCLTDYGIEPEEVAAAGQGAGYAGCAAGQNNAGCRVRSRACTAEIQALIDRAAAAGGGVIVVPRGTFITGSLYFKQGVNLYLCEGAVLKGSDDISDYGLGTTRIEGQTCTYFHALINVEGTDGWTLCGPGTIDGNGERSWRAFWQRRRWNPACTNKDEQRARLLYICNSSNVTISGVTLQNAQFWTSHLYRCDHVKYLGVRILSPAAPIKAPSTDAIDLDVCSDVLVKDCYLAVNDDSVVLKGGKGPWADSDPSNGSNERIIVEDCTYGFCHGCLTCGSESVHNRNILMRRIRVTDGCNLLWLKMRPDTPQHYEYITLENIEASVSSFININPWKQFYDLGTRRDIPKSYADHITVRDCTCRCRTYLDIENNAEQYELSDFVLKNLSIRAAAYGCAEPDITGFVTDNVTVELCPENEAPRQDEEELGFRK